MRKRIGLPVLFWMSFWALIIVVLIEMLALVTNAPRYAHAFYFHAIYAGIVGAFGGLVGAALGLDYRKLSRCITQWAITLSILIGGSGLSILGYFPGLNSTFVLLTFWAIVGAVGDAIGCVVFKRISDLSTIRTLLSIVGIVLLSVLIIALSPADKPLVDESVSVGLVSSDNPEQLKFENESVIVQFGCDQYIAYLHHRIDIEDDYPKPNLEKKLNKIEADGCDDEELSLSLGEIADMLELGTASVYEKRSHAYINMITVRTYVIVCGPLCGSGNRYFYLPDGTKFLEIQDWIS